MSLAVVFGEPPKLIAKICESIHLSGEGSDISLDSQTHNDWKTAKNH